MKTTVEKIASELYEALKDFVTSIEVGISADIIRECEKLHPRTSSLVLSKKAMRLWEDYLQKQTSQRRRS